MPGNKGNKSEYNYHYNIIHDDKDAGFANDLAEYLKQVNPRWKGFYSDLRMPGSNILTAAGEEIEGSKVNICLTKQSMNRTLDHIQQYLLQNKSADQLIFVAHSGYKSKQLAAKFMLPNTYKVVEFMLPEDPLGREELAAHLKHLLDGKPREEKMSVEETATPGHISYPDQRKPVYSRPPTKQSEQVFKDALTDIAKELGSQDVKALQFLLGPSQRELIKLKTSTEALEFVEKIYNLSHKNSLLLIDLLEALDRDDLANRVRRNSTRPPGGHGISPYRKMLFSVVSQINENEIEKVKTVLVDVFNLAKRPVDSCRDGLEIFRLLEKEDRISETEYERTRDFLLELADYLTEETRASMYHCIQQRPDDGGCLVDGPQSPTKLEFDSIQSINILKKEHPEMADVLDSFIECNIEMYREIGYDEMKKYYNKDDCLGEGGFGKVYRGVKRFSDVDVVVKVSSDRQEKRRKQFVREKGFAGLRHYALLPILAVCDLSEKHYMIMYPFMPNQDLSRWLNDKPNSRLPERVYIRILTQVAEALDFLHTPVRRIRYSIRHGDVKPSNVLLDAKFMAKLGDAGLADELDSIHDYVTATSPQGTVLYYDEHTYNTVERIYEKKLTNDVYAFGISMVQVIYGISGDYLYHNRSRYLQDQLPSSRMSPNVHNCLTQLVKDCINKDVKKRKKMKEVLTALKTVHAEFGAEHTETSTAKCVQCLVNKTAKQLPCDCGCAVFCQSCLKRAYCNPLRCPTHGPTQPPIGHDNMFAILVAPSSGADVNNFNNDVGSVYRTFTDPNVMGISENNLYRLVEEKDGKQQLRTTKANLKEVVEKVKSRSTPKSTIIFYISCHADNIHFQLGTDLVERSEIVAWLSKLQFQSLLLIWDCCYAADNSCLQNEIDTHDKNIYQWFSCSSKQQSFLRNGKSLFTSCILEGLNGLAENCPDLLPSWQVNQYIDLLNLQKFVWKRMKEINKQDPRSRMEINGDLKLAYYSGHHRGNSLLFQGPEGTKNHVKLKRRPRHYKHIELLRSEIWKDIQPAYDRLDETFLQIVEVKQSKGQEFCCEVSDLQGLKCAREERLHCQLRQDPNQFIHGRPLVRLIRDEEWQCMDRCLKSNALKPFVNAVEPGEYSVKLEASGQRVGVAIHSFSKQTDHKSTRRCLKLLQDVFEQCSGKMVIVKSIPHYVTFKLTQ